MNNFYIGYYRKSTDTEDKQILSLPDQKRVIKDFAPSKNLYIPRKFNFEESKSAKSPGRPVFNHTVELLKQGKAKGVVAYKSDRLTRNFTDLGTLVDLIESGVEVWATDYGQYKNTANDKMMLAMNTVMAKRKVDDLSEDTKRGLEMKITIQEWPGVAPLGYLNINPEGRIAGKQFDRKIQRMLDDLDRPLERIEPDPTRAHFIPKAFNLYLSGQYSLKTLSIKLTEDGLTTRKDGPITKTTLENILKNSFYYGVMDYKDKLTPGRHQPLIAKALFDVVQDKLSSRSPFQAQPQKHIFDYSNLLHCGECGCLITAEKKVKKQKNGNVHKYIYYHCTHSKKCSQKGCIEQKELEKQLRTIFKQFAISNQIASFVQAKLAELFEEDIRYQQTSENALKTHLIELKAEKKKLYRKIVNDKIQDRKMIEELKQDIEKEIAQAEEKLENITRHTKDYLEQSSNLLYLAKHAHKLFLRGTREQKHILLNCVASNLLLRDKKVYFSHKKPFDILAKGSKRPIGLAGWDDFRTVEWYKIVKYPEVVIKQAQQFLHLYG
jgi:DNA invertase Pin-like site-specific DNA recombinase